MRQFLLINLLIFIHNILISNCKNITEITSIKSYIKNATSFEDIEQVIISGGMVMIKFLNQLYFIKNRENKFLLLNIENYNI